MNDKVLVQVTARNINTFLKKIYSENIFYSNLKLRSHKLVTLQISYTDYLKLSKSKLFEIKIIKYKGLNGLIHNFINYKHDVIAFLLSIAIVFILSNLTLNIKVIHNDKEIRTLIKDELKDNDISRFKLSPSYKKIEKVKNKILNFNKDKIEWLEIERKGSMLFVKVTERKTNLNKKESKNRNLVAKKEGIIKKITASKGVVLKKKNDYVNKGDIIISGNIIKDDVVKGQVAAQGSVYAEVWYKASIEYPLDYEEVRYLDKMNYDIMLSFFNKHLSFKNNHVMVKSYPIINIYKDNIVPIKLDFVKERKTKIIKQKVSTKKAVKKATLIATKNILRKLKKDEYILSKKVLNFSDNGSTIEVDIFFKVYENIGEYKNSDAVDNLQTQE